MGFLIGFIQKDRQCEAMVEKLCARFAASDAVAYHRNVAFCVGDTSTTRPRHVHDTSTTRPRHVLDDTQARCSTRSGLCASSPS
jgi:hypothetical protein